MRRSLSTFRFTQLAPTYSKFCTEISKQPRGHRDHGDENSGSPFLSDNTLYKCILSVKSMHNMMLIRGEMFVETQPKQT